MGFPELLHAAGGMGKFQVLYTVLILFPAILASCNNFLQIFMAMTPEHHCRPANWTNGSHVPGGVGDRDWLRVFIPLDKDQKPERCLRFSEPHWQTLNLSDDSFSSLATEPCLDGWVYDQSVDFSIVSEWDLVCEHKSLKSIAQSIHMTGQLVGATAFGIFSDRYGRRRALQGAALLMVTVGTGTAFAPTFPAYCALRFISGMAVAGVSITSLCLTMERTPMQRRTLVNTFTMYMVSLGQAILSGLAYLLRPWRWLQGTVTISYAIILLYSWGLLESACWLITHHKLDMAVKNLQAVARINGGKEQGRKLTPEVVSFHMHEDLAAVKDSSFLLDLFRTPGLRRITCCIALGWFSAGFAFYGLASDLQRFGFNIYWTQTLFAIVDLPAKLLAGLSMGYLGRRITMVSLLLVAGCTILVIIFLPRVALGPPRGLRFRSP